MCSLCDSQTIPKNAIETQIVINSAKTLVGEKEICLSPKIHLEIDNTLLAQSSEGHNCTKIVIIIKWIVLLCSHL